MNTTETIAEAIASSFINLWNKVLLFTPEILSAILIMIVGVIIAPIVAGFVRRLINFIKLDSLANRVGITEMFQSVGLDFSFSGLIGKLVKWFILIAFLIAAVDVLGWTRVNDFLVEVALYIPNVIVAVIIFAVGMIVGGFLEKVVRQAIESSSMPITNPQMLASVARWAIVAFASLAALLQLGVAERLIEILFAGIVFALALAFGLGGRDKAAEILERLDGTKARTRNY